MKDSWIRLMAWLTALIALAILITATVIFFLVTDRSNFGWLGFQVGDLVAMGAPILGLSIASRQPRNRIGWLWIFYGLFVGVRSLGHAIYYFGGSQPSGYSALQYFLLWSTEAANLSVIGGLILLLLWFPDGQLPSRRWRFLYIWLLPAWAVLFSSLFEAGPNWNGGVEAGGIVIDNPYGWLPANTVYNFGFPAFISLVLITILAAVSLIFRYLSAGPSVRLQLRWFVMGSLVFVVLFFLPVFTQLSVVNQRFDTLLFILGQAAVIPLYLAVGAAILRYRLWDIDLIIRKTLQYSILTGLLALIYFGSVVLLQSLTENLLGEQSPLVIVLSTLAIAALVGPLRVRVQNFIDRRFYRKKYDAERALAQFAATARDEVELDMLTDTLLSVVEETVQPKHVSLWVKKI